MKYTWIVCLIILLECSDGVYSKEHVNGRYQRSASSNSTTANNNTITALLDKALPVYCSTVENIHGVIPTATALPGFVHGQTPTAQPGLVSGQTPTAKPGLVSGQTPTAQHGLPTGYPPTPQPGLTWRPGATTMMVRTTIPSGGGSGGVALTTQSVYNNVRVVALNDSQMHEVFQHKGGNYLHDYMAATKEEAKNNFPNLLLMTKPVKIAGTNSTLTAADNMLAQKTIIQDLQKLQVFLSASSKSSANAPATSTTSHAVPTTAAYSKSNQLAKTVSSAQHSSSVTAKSSNVTSSGAQSSFTSTNIATLNKNSVANAVSSIAPTSSQSLVSVQPTSFQSPTTGRGSTPSLSTQKLSPNKSNGSLYHGNKTIGPTTISNPPAPGVSSTNNKNVTSSSSTNLQYTKVVPPTPSRANLVPTFSYKTPTPYPWPPTKNHPTIESVVSKSIFNLNTYVNGWSSDNGYHDLDTLWRDANTTIHPETLMELVPGNRRKKREADGSISEEQYCELKGSKTQDGYLHMCSTCAVITKLPENYFPRYINEAVCKTGDSNCFVINGIPHGECRQRTITLNIMRKKQNKCLLVVKNGENIMIDDWELYPKTIRVSCECLIKKNSFLAPYVKGSQSRV